MGRKKEEEPIPSPFVVQPLHELKVQLALLNEAIWNLHDAQQIFVQNATHLIKLIEDEYGIKSTKTRKDGEDPSPGGIARR